MAIIWVGTGRFSAYIGPVQDYIDRVVAADVAAGNTLGLEVGVRDAYDVFIRDSINVGDLGTSGGVLSQANSIIKAAPIMAGARTLAGALVPLVGPAPTNFNFVAGDYDRKTGLKGNGSTKYLNSNRNNNADPQNSKHLAVFQTSVATADSLLIATTNNPGRSALISLLATGISQRINSNAVASNNGNGVGFVGGVRTTSTATAARVNGTNFADTITSQTPLNENIGVFATATGQVHTNARLAFYSIGESLNLALLDARITTLINTFGAVIP
jgi:hypothetical protein